MRAWQIQKHGEPAEAIQLCEVPVPEPQPDEVRIRVAAAGLGLPDVFLCRGSYAYRPSLPFTPGQEVAGVVSAVGAEASTAVGTRVMAVTAFFRGFGGLAEEALALDAATHPAPEDMDATDAAGFVIPYHTAAIGLTVRGRLQAGESLLVLGAAGGSGAAAIQLGRALGARVIAVASGPEKSQACRALGADEVVDSRAQDLVTAVREATGKRGADVVFDPVGGESFDAALECIASEGRVLAIGYASGAWHDASTAALVRKNASVVGVFVGAYAKPFLSELHTELLSHWKSGRIRSLVSKQVDFEDVPQALGEIAARRATGKIVARVAGAIEPGTPAGRWRGPGPADRSSGR
jgi:NADPH2:quinone reductase